MKICLALQGQLLRSMDMMLKAFGIVTVHFPNEMSTIEVNRYLLERFNDLSENDFKGNLIIVEPRKIRIRRK
ncbi:MAG: hypothetical protein KAW83_00395 [Dehalococcoidia bacterium]|nr:hypothetical protein [Dehalococcoidia bacterium]